MTSEPEGLILSFLFERHHILPDDYWGKPPGVKKVIRALAANEGEKIQEAIEKAGG